ncbi:DUF4870 domain-containing protein [Rummeliibacillus pycnus]|uniref:DUF4870 domain-containing protein n=1 Tax=Rummeliibacillus pycnus TaxID=101070 RepID=UPI000C99CC68|nr:DUF4870 domain-containing protein [Rummeliibacillus pycnus]
MDNNRILSSLCYFSIFFAGFILPLIVYFVTTDRDVKGHAKRAFISHLLLIIPTVLGIILFIFTIASNPFSYETNIMNESSGAGTFLVIAWFIFVIVEVVISIAVFIWNIIQGVKVLKA